MMDAPNPEVLACMDNYHVRLIAPAQMSDDEIMKFQSSLREVMFFIKYSKDRKSLDRILDSNEKRFRKLERRAADVIEIITNTGIKYDEREEEVDVCQAIQEMKREAEHNGELRKSKEAAKNFHSMGIEVEKIAQGLGQTTDVVRQWLGVSTGK